ncbi:hypothetical protein HZS_6735 [Henneguya salminicola]|nr:hypothetical protein HZS_6735 [Henneguya salminicola]
MDNIKLKIKVVGKKEILVEASQSENIGSIKSKVVEQLQINVNPTACKLLMCGKVLHGRFL